MSQGGSESRTVGLPQNNTSPGMGGLGIGGGIYGNPFQVNQLSQPPMMQGGSGLMQSPFNPMGQGQPMPPGGQLFNQMNQMSSPFRSPPASMLQGQGAMLNQPMNMQAGLGSLIPGNYAAQR